MKTRLQLPTIQFKEIDIDLDELENFCKDCVSKSANSREKDFWHLSLNEVNKHRAGKPYLIYPFLEAVYLLLEATYPDMYEECFNPYFEYEEGQIETQLAKILADMKDLNE